MFLKKGIVLILLKNIGIRYSFRSFKNEFISRIVSYVTTLSYRRPNGLAWKKNNIASTHLMGNCIPPLSISGN